MGILNEVVTSIPFGVFGVSLLLPLSWGAFCDYWWRIVVLTLGLATFLWVVRRIAGRLTKTFSQRVRDAADVVSSFLIFGVFSLMGFLCVLRPNYGHKVIGLPRAYAFAHLILFVTFFLVPQLPNILKLFSLFKTRIDLLSLLKRLLPSIPAILKLIIKIIKFDPNLTFFVRTNGDIKYTIFFSQAEQKVYYVLLLFVSVLIFKPWRYKPDTQ